MLNLYLKSAYSMQICLLLLYLKCDENYLETEEKQLKVVTEWHFNFCSKHYSGQHVLF